MGIANINLDIVSISLNAPSKYITFARITRKKDIKEVKNNFSHFFKGELSCLLTNKPTKDKIKINPSKIPPLSINNKDPIEKKIISDINLSK